MRQSVLLFSLASLVCATQHDFLEQSDAVFLKELAIAKPAKYIQTTSEINLAVVLSMQIFLTTLQEHWLVNNLAQLPAQSKF